MEEWSAPLTHHDEECVVKISRVQPIHTADTVDEEFDATSGTNVLRGAFGSSVYIRCLSRHFSAPTSSISLLISDKRHAELRGPILIGGGYLPSFMP